ncbi:uncharacterized protein J4E78_006522 [Alternaria triticimaculans]|uniref:uncharacterized protein n=1 Tax=Alternaria triticimaculans TaxID=297637 RepID=UPI0020C356A5|nr:uncharacterized protein J4E78_006522 [Alternaria triticimaculans]KAI4656632.1 hypothetical protein J4E78_006522 [Alternaria triticimaculans]
MSDAAKILTTKLRKELGNLPIWKVATTQECMDKGETTWLIKRKYCSQVDDYNRFRPLARSVHQQCRREIGKFPDVTVDVIKRWIDENYWDDAQVKAEYQRQFHKAHPEIRRAKKLLAELRRDLGDCHLVDEQNVLKWVKKNLTDKRVEDKYRSALDRAGPLNRAEALRYRLEDEGSDELVVSNAVILEECRDNSNDTAVVDAILMKFDVGQGQAAGEDVGGVQEEGTQEG